LKAIEQDEFRTLFLADFYLKIPLLQKKIKKVVYKKLGRFPEAGNIDDIVENCISDIESILIKQLNAKPDELFNYKERKRKLALFKKDKSYLEKYILEAAKSFCRKK
jgi:hypothetical protein